MEVQRLSLGHSTYFILFFNQKIVLSYSSFPLKTCPDCELITHFRDLSLWIAYQNYLHSSALSLLRRECYIYRQQSKQDGLSSNKAERLKLYRSIDCCSFLLPNSPRYRTALCKLDVTLFSQFARSPL